MLSLNTSYAGFAMRGLDSSQSQLERAMARMASGRRINSAADDAAGAAIASRLQARLGGMQVAQRGLLDGLSLAETADGALGQVTQSLQRMRELGLQAMNGTYGAKDRASLDAEYQQLGAEVSRVLGGTTFNGRKILGADAGPLQFQTGPESSDTLTVQTVDLAASPDVAAVTVGSVGSAPGAKAAVDHIDQALKTLSDQRASLGATQSRFNAIADDLDLRFETSSASYSRTMDADMAAESASLQSAQVSRYAAIAMLAKSNQAQQGLLSLFL